MGNIGTSYIDKGDYKKAEEYLSRALSIQSDLGNKDGIAISTANLAQVYQQKGEYPKALEFLEKSVSISKEIGRKEYIKEAYTAIAEIYIKQGNFQKACDYQQLLMQLKDTIYNIESNKNIAEMQTRFDTEKKERENLALKQQNEFQALSINRQRIISYSVSLGLVLVIALAFFIYRSYAQKKAANEKITRQKEEIEEKNKEILDSITYAKRIQTAILPPESMRNNMLPEHFVLYKPKDIVSGDFYWMESLVGKEPGAGSPGTSPVLFAAVDCTGHGVPGAMVSVVGHNGLNRTVREFGLKEPASILDKLTLLVEETFEKSESEVKDGMDISLVSLQYGSENSGIILQYAGANNPLWILKKEKGKGDNGSVELLEVKGDKQPIGKFEARKPFTNHRIPVEKGDTLYIFTDGYADQFGGPKKKKFKYKQLKELLVSIQGLPMAEQHTRLENAYEAWKGELEQVDDVCIIGVRL